MNKYVRWARIAIVQVISFMEMRGKSWKCDLGENYNSQNSPATWTILHWSWWLKNSMFWLREESTKMA